MNRKELGRLGEEQAAAMLRAKGYTIVERNWSCRAGELDLIARRGYTVVFVEVKTRRSLDFGTPAEAVNADKRRHIRHAASSYLKMNHMENVDVRFDVVEIYMNHIERAF
ncbi:MAG: YraN family protein [Anaerovoracaceae bacterium]|jgi:putative endonuclease